MADDLEQRKAAMRTLMRTRLREMTAEQRHEASAAACRRIMALEPFKKAQSVMMYMPLEREVDVTPLAIKCFQEGKSICVPRVDWDRREMEAIVTSTFDDHVMECDAHGLRCPRDGRPCFPEELDLVLMPGLAFDAAGRRLGRGGGFYDRFLGRLRPDAMRIGIAFDAQVAMEVPFGPGDAAVDIVVTDQRTTMTSAAAM